MLRALLLHSGRCYYYNGSHPDFIFTLVTSQIRHHGREHGLWPISMNGFIRDVEAFWVPKPTVGKSLNASNVA